MTDAPSTYKIPTVCDVPADFRVNPCSAAPRRRALHVIFGSKAVGEPPLMLAISVREALREAVAAFGPGGVSPRCVALAAPATPEALWRAIRAVREARS
jgi:xanthine dehydrogenase large subunit